MSQARYTVHYDVGTYEGDVVVWADTDAETDQVVAKAKREVYRGARPPAGLYSEQWRVTEKVDLEDDEENPKKARKGKKGKKPEFDEHEREVMFELDTAMVDGWRLPRKQQTRTYWKSDGEPYKAAKRLVKRGHAWVQDEGATNGKKWVEINMSDRGIAVWASFEQNPAKRGRARKDEIVVYIQTPGAPARSRAIRIDHFVDGVFAIHPSLRNIREIELGRRKRPQSHAITHVPTGQLVATVRTKDWAKKLAEQIVAFSDVGYESTDPHVVAHAVGGPGLRRAKYILHVSRQSMEPSKKRGKFPTFKAWEKTSGGLEQNPEDLRTQAAVSAAVGSLVGGFIGALGGALILGGVGVVIGASMGAGTAVATGGAVGAAYGIPLGAYIGTIWGAVRQTERALEGYPSTEARILAGLGAALTGPLAPVGAGVGAYLGAPE